MSTLIQITPPSANFANTDLTFTGTRNHDTAGNALNVYVDIAYDKGYFDIGPFGSTFGFNRSFHSYGTNSIQGYANNSLIQTLTQTGVGIGTSTPAARLDVRAQGALSTDIAFRVRNSADTMDILNIAGNGDMYFSSMATTTPVFDFAINEGGNRRSIFRLTSGGSNSSPSRVDFSNPFSGGGIGMNIFNQLAGLDQLYLQMNRNNFCFGSNTIATATTDRRVVYINNGTAPTASVTDGFKMYSADIVAGNAAPHFRTETGDVIKLYKETTGVVAAAFVANTSAIVDDSATYGGYTMGQVVAALKAQGLLA